MLLIGKKVSDYRCSNQAGQGEKVRESVNVLVAGDQLWKWPHESNLAGEPVVLSGILLRREGRL